ncbi:autotransporter-associated N-terminal domain-containing protein, partial [Fusobacterium simiae]
MGNNNLYKVENTLRSMAKRYKSVKYSLGLAILFLMMGVSAFSEEVVAQEAAVQQEVMTNEQIASSRENLKNSVGNLQSKIDSARAENEKALTGLKLELVQLMEQGDQVVKSPWASWQFGANYMYSKWNGTYKGRGDKSEKYPFEGIFTRSTNVFGRTTTARTANQKAALASIIATSGGFDPNGNGLSYGLITRAQINEDPMTIEVSAGIRPKNIQKGAITLNVPPVNVQPPTPSLTTINPVAPAAPNINIPSFAPVAPDVTPPDLPVPPTFAVILGADCNHGCNSSSSTPRQLSNTAFVNAANNSTVKPSMQNERMILHYTWPAGSGSFSSPDDRASLAFKMYKDESWVRLTNRNGPNAEASETDNNNKIYFNSYNTDYTGYTGTKEFGSVVNSGGAGQPDKNHQYFFVGGSRFWEVDNRNQHFTFASGRTVNLGGILTLGMVSQENGSTLENAGTITDVEEKDEKWIKDMPYDTTGVGAGKYLSIMGPGYDPANADATVYKIKKSTDGYVGYKVAIAQVQENDNQGKNVLLNTGLIDFRGERSIGIYAYIPRHLSANTRSEAKLLNRKDIRLSGAESYGMKFAAKAGTNVEMTNEAAGTITLRKNPNGSDKADNSAAMALMADASVADKVSLAEGKAVNNGNINLQDNIGNSIGMFVNIDSNMTNNKNINISARASKTNNKYNLNSGMRADQVNTAGSTAATYNTAVINAAGANINITGQGAIGMVANGKTTVGTATATNRGTISVDKGTSTVAAEQGKDSYGMLATNQASIVNDTTGKINIGTSPNSVGMTSMLQGTNVSKAENKGEINITGPNSTGVYNTGEFLMNTATAKINVAGRQSIGLYAKGQATQTKTELKAGTVQASNSGVGLYSDKSVVNLDNTSNNLNLIANNGGLLFYNYESNNAANVANGVFRLTGNVKATVNNGGYAFYLKGTTIQTNGNITGLSTFFNSMFDSANSTGNLNITLNAGGTLMILDKPQGGEIKLSSVANPSSIASALGSKVTINNASTKYKVYAVYRGKLEIDQNVSLDKDSTTTTPDAFYRVDFRSSTMKLDAGKTMTGAKAGQVALFQGNYDEGGTSKGKVGEISIINNGTIRLTGNSTGNA